MEDRGGPQEEAQMLNQEIQEVLGKATAYVEGHVIDASLGRMCVDGRYKDGAGMIARPGGDLGYVMVLLAFNRKNNWGFSAQQVVGFVYEYVTRDGGEFFMHTDEHAEHKTKEDPLSIGCGHVALALVEGFAPDYLLDSEDLREALVTLREKQEEWKDIKKVVLEGEHKEKGVLIVESREKTVSPRDGEEMYFVYDETRDQDFMQGLVDFLSKEKGLDVTFDEFKQVSDIQVEATLQKLAPTKPILRVRFEDSSPQFNFEGLVPSH